MEAEINALCDLEYVWEGKYYTVLFPITYFQRHKSPHTKWNEWKDTIFGLFLHALNLLVFLLREKNARMQRQQGREQIPVTTLKKPRKYFFHNHYEKVYHTLISPNTKFSR